MIQRYQLPQHSSTRSFSRVLPIISIPCFFCLRILVTTSFILQVVVTRSCWGFGDLLRINVLRSFLPLANCSCAWVNNSSSVLMLLATRNSDISIFCNFWFLVYINYLLTSFSIFDMTFYKLICSFWSWLSQFPVSQGGFDCGQQVMYFLTNIFIFRVIGFVTFRKVYYYLMV